jgi:hypothetical protein
MAFSVERIKTYRRWFGWGFVGSSFSSLLLASFFWYALRGSASSLPSPAPPDGWLDAQTLLALGSLVTSFTTLIGFVVTTVITWRKERRESNHASIELETKQLELEKLRREISDRNSAAQKKKKTTKRRWVD